MRYCKQCVLPDSRPGLYIDDEGICSACRGQEEKKSVIDWEKRELELKELLADTCRERPVGYDCVVPVSGGKDSTWQVLKCLDYGLNILAVTWKTPGRSSLGQKNLDNLVRLGVDHIDYTINPEVEKQFMYKSLVRTGSTAVPMHLALYTIPLKIAAAFKIPLVIWGESPEMEYGGSEEERKNAYLDRAWMQKHRILQGTSIEDWIDEDLRRKDLSAYFLPSDAEFRAAAVKSIFLGYYLPWDPEISLKDASENGFQIRKEGPKTGYYNYADIDCDFISIHHYFKWLKFGFTRLFDNLAIEIRNGRMSRDEALQIIYDTGDQRPDKDIEQLCAFLNISIEHFEEIEEKFRNLNIWTVRNGKWVIDDFLIKDWKW